MKMNELELVKTVVHNYLIATLTYSTLVRDIDKIEQVVKVVEPYKRLLEGKIKLLDDEIKKLRKEMVALQINSELPSADIDNLFVEYTIVAKGEEHKVMYARAALKYHVADKMNLLFEGK